MATQSLGKRTAEFLRSEANGDRSRAVGTVDATGGALVAGTVLGQVTASGKYIRHDTGAADGSEDAVAILYEGIGAEEAERTLIVRDAEVLAAHLTYEASATSNEITAVNTALAALGIIVR